LLPSSELQLEPLHEGALRALLLKYETLLTFRYTLPSGPLAPALRPTLKRLSEDFPGALRELDAMPTIALEERRTALLRALSGGVQSSWMAPMFTFHILMKLALAARMRLREGDRAGALGLIAAAPVPLDENFIDAITTPPTGRMSEVVLDLVARLLGRERGELKRELFPRP
jgi:hypothetical protein